VVWEIHHGPRFRQKLALLSRTLGRSEADVEAEATGDLAEMTAGQNRLALFLWRQLERLGSRAYEMDVDASPIPELRRLSRRGPLVFLPSHRSYLDPLVLRTALRRYGFPPNHVLGGINVAFWPVGPIGRRAGLVFIRRRVRDDPVYRFVLREYLGYLIRHRFNLEWYLEGGRTRTGKLRPPRLGLLFYLVEAFRRQRDVGEVHLVPVSIVYDLLYEVGALEAEEGGAGKRPESLGWAIGYARAQGRGLGGAHVRFGEPLALSDALAGDRSVEGLAGEICRRINRATPVTPTALVCLAFSGTGGAGLTLAEIEDLLAPLLAYLSGKRLAVSGFADLRSVEGLAATIDALAAQGVLRRHGDGRGVTWSLARSFEAAFYRNGVAAHFVNRALVELIAARGEAGFTEEASRLRALLEFEFFFPDDDDFTREMEDEFARFDPDGPCVAPQLLLPSLEAYLVVAEELAARGDGPEGDEEAFVSRCLETARRWRRQGRIDSDEAAAADPLRTSLRLARHRGLLEAGPELARRRVAFAADVAEVLARLEDLRSGRRSLDPVVIGDGSGEELPQRHQALVAQ
jgi:glycerol-3-phosphate O-acyltransferase